MLLKQVDVVHLNQIAHIDLDTVNVHPEREIAESSWCARNETSRPRAAPKKKQFLTRSNCLGASAQNHGLNSLLDSGKQSVNDNSVGKLGARKFCPDNQNHCLEEVRQSPYVVEGVMTTKQHSLPWNLRWRGSLTPRLGHQATRTAQNTQPVHHSVRDKAQQAHASTQGALNPSEL